MAKRKRPNAAPKDPTLAELEAHESRIEDQIIADGGGDADRAGMRAYYRQLIAEGYDPLPPELRADRRERDREVIAVLTRDGGGVADKAEMLAEYHRLLAAGWKP